MEKGKYSGGNCYGYRVAKRLDVCGQPLRGEGEIVRKGVEKWQWHYSFSERHRFS
jgi:site-specific DNA recombinase